MNTNGLAKQYQQLTGEERFKVIIAAEERGDEAEADRLANAAKNRDLVCRDHVPYVEALDKLALLIFTDLAEDAANHLDLMERTENASLSDYAFGRKHKRSGSEDGRTKHLWELSLAQGFVLKTKMQGWKLFCTRMGIAPFGPWKRLRGFDRLQRALEVVELQSTSKRPFSRLDAVRWANRRRPDGEPERTEADIISAEGFADQAESMFRELARYMGADE
jgi:hypothetical protein